MGGGSSLDVGGACGGLCWVNPGREERGVREVWAVGSGRALVVGGRSVGRWSLSCVSR